MRMRPAFLAAIVLTGILVTVPSLEAQRSRSRNCGQRVRQAELGLQRAVQRYGVHSRQAQQKRRVLKKVQERCGSI